MTALTAILLYLGFLGYFTWRNLRTELAGDRVTELACLNNILNDEGKANEVLQASFLVHTLPILLYRVVGGSPFMWFRLIPGFFYALLPASLFLICVQFVSPGYALLAVGILSLGFEILYFTDTGRVGMALGLLSVLYWGVLTDNWLVVGIMSILLALTHYGTIYYALFVFGSAFGSALLIGLPLQMLSIASNFLLGNIWLWYSVLLSRMSGFCGSIISGMRLKAGDFDTSWLYTCGESKRHRLGFQLPAYLDYRDILISVALGKLWSRMSLPSKIEFFTSWLLVIAINVALLISFVLQPVNTLWLVAFWGYMAIMVSIFVPTISRAYGVERTCFTASLFILPFLAITMERFNVLSFTLFIIPILMLHGLLVSGVAHSLLGYNKHKLAEQHYAGFDSLALKEEKIWQL